MEAYARGEAWKDTALEAAQDLLSDEATLARALAQRPPLVLLVRESLESGAKKVAAKDPRVTFEVMSGTLTVGRLVLTNGVELKGGKLNIYLSAALIAAAANRCFNEADIQEVAECVHAAFEAGEKGVADFVGSEDTVTGAPIPPR